MTEHKETIAYCQACGTPMDVSEMAPFANVECPDCGTHTRVKCEFGPYTLVRRHAVGGMSMVFAAHDSTLDREVALKILSEDFSADERRITAFEEEARITASFSHPNVVRVLTTGRAFGRFYIAMEFVPGGHFEHQIRERGKIPEVEMLPLAIEVAQGLKAAQSAGLIHRDVKPGNILLDAAGHAKLVDFGLALVTHGGKAQATEMWATPYYVPPETVEGSAEDFRSDIYAFGATLYHSLAGKPSCGEESMATDVLREAKKNVVPLSLADPSISAATCQIVERTMAYEPDDRFSSYNELIANLETALSQIKSGRTAVTNTAATRRAGKKRQRQIAVAACGLAVIASAVGILWWPHRTHIQPSVATPPAVEIPLPPAPPDTSADIARSYRAARAAVDAKDYQKAANEFVLLYQKPAVQEPTRTWAGVQAVTAYLLDGRSPAARKQAQETVEHARALPPNTAGVGADLLETLAQLDKLPPLPAPPRDTVITNASQVIATMLAGLKNWEQGLLEPAADCFSVVVAAKLPGDDSWATIYQKLAADYLSDYQLFCSPLFTSPPVDKTACAKAISELDAAAATIKTRGRAKFNLRAWQLDLARQVRLAETATPEDAPGK